MEEFWGNYVSNAIKYDGHHPPKVVWGFTEEVGGCVRYWVRDNGPGLAEEECSRLFTPFTRLSQVRAESHSPGLSIVRRIAGRLGGEIGVFSQPGEGSETAEVLICRRW